MQTSDRRDTSEHNNASRNWTLSVQAGGSGDEQYGLYSTRTADSSRHGQDGKRPKKNHKRYISELAEQIEC
eukprot:scaffold109615_cov50-Prasinocladus_malaysianus.AAC.2